jgi:phage-related protein
MSLHGNEDGRKTEIYRKVFLLKKKKNLLVLHSFCRKTQKKENTARSTIT